MIPSVSPSILESNPLFASLHGHLVVQLLNPDASTRLNKETQVPVSGGLEGYQLRAAEEELLRSSLRSVAAGSGEWAGDGGGKLGLDLRDLVDRISMLLDEAPRTDLTVEDYNLLAPDIGALHDHSEEVAGAVSIDLQRRCDLLCQIACIPSHHTFASRAPSSAKPAANSKRPLDRHPITTTTTTTTTLSSLASSDSLSALLLPLLPTTPDTALQSALAALSTTILQHATVHRTLLITTLTHLERTIHGLHARHTKARSGHLSAVATALAKRIQVVYLQSRNRVYGPDVQLALGNYRRHLEEVMVKLEDRTDMLTALLKEYDDVRSEAGGGGGDDGQGQGQRGVMRGVGRRYGELLGEIEQVKREIGKLESSGEGGGK